MNNLLRFFYFICLVRPVVFLLLGLNVRRKSQLPVNGPVIIAANHNSHLDTMVLMSLIPAGKLSITRPVAAIDYFLKNNVLSWFARNIIGIIPLSRTVKAGTGRHPLDGCFQALEQGNILIIFPEGSRGNPEELSRFKSGTAHLAERYPEVPVLPVFMHGLGKSLPKGEALLVPFVCDIFIGTPFHWEGSRTRFLQTLDEKMEQLAAEGNFPSWE